MKRLLAAVVLVLFLPGCGGKDSQMNRALALRERLQAQLVEFPVLRPEVWWEFP